MKPHKTLHRGPGFPEVLAPVQIRMVDQQYVSQAVTSNPMLIVQPDVGADFLEAEM